MVEHLMHTFLTRRLAVLSLAHFTIDAYSSFYLPLLPLLVAKLGLDYAKVGGLVAISSMSSSFSQPLFGLLADRLRRPWFVAAGPLVAALFLSAIGMASNYLTLVVLLVLGGVGVAAFHPQTASLAGESSPRRDFAMSFWITGGTLGWALGPMFATFTVDRFGLERTWVSAIPGVVLCALLFAWFSRVKPVPHGHRVRTRLADLRPVARPLTLLYCTVVCRSAVSSGFATFLPLWVHERGWSLHAGGVLTTVYLTLGALGGLFGGWLSSRVGRRRVVVQSFTFATPFFAAFFLLPEKPGLVCLVIGYFLMQGSLPVNVVMGQELSPRHSGTISSLLMGAAWGVGALLIGPIGALADHAGLHTALMVLSSLIVVGAACAWQLPRGNRNTPAEPHVALGRTAGGE
ncbi:MAG: MFS transporter [Candidatus Eisenbacteria bacterium]